MPLTEVRAYRDVDGSIPIMEWLEEVEHRDLTAYEALVQRILLLGQLGYELRRPLVGTLGQGLYEIRVRRISVHYRILYFFHGRNAVTLSHGFTKEDKIPRTEIDRALKRMAQVLADPDKHTAEWTT